jgi:superkiller protein 3
MPSYRNRATGLDSMLDELFGTSGLEGDWPAEQADFDFPLRPFTAMAAQDELIPSEPRTDETPVERLYRRALEATSRGRPAEAIQRYRELLMIEPGHLAARHNLATLLESSGDPQEAVEQLTAALRVQPDDVAMLVSRGAIHGRLKQYAEAEADLRRALKLSPDHVEAHLALGLALWRKGVPREAAEALHRAIQLQPDNAAAFYYLGEAQNQAGDLPAARTALEQAAALQPDAKTYRLLGRVLDRMGKYDEAQGMYRRAREAGGV